MREADEFVEGAIPSSINMPLSTLMESFKLPDAIFKERFGVDKPAKEQDLTFYCLKGIRSVTATDIARSNGYTKCVHSLQILRDLLNICGSLFDYTGSWMEWVAQPGAQIYNPLETETRPNAET